MKTPKNVANKAKFPKLIGPVLNKPVKQKDTTKAPSKPKKRSALAKKQAATGKLKKPSISVVEDKKPWWRKLFERVTTPIVLN